MKRFLFTLTFLGLCFYELHAQKENNHWVAGLNVKVDFNTPVPTASQGLNMMEGSCAVSNRHTGELMFSSNGIKVWDKNGVVMPNGSGLLGGTQSGINSTTQGALVVPFIDDTTKFYLFTLQGQDSPFTTPGELHYSVVDMTLNGGLGDVVLSQKNIFVHDSLCEGMVAVKGDGCSVWVVTHERVNNIYKAFEVTSLGVNTTPVISNVPDIIYTPSFYIWPSVPYNFTQLKSSPDGTYLCMATQGYAILNDFDKVTGVVSNPVTLDSADNSQGIIAVFSCFSPGSDILYVSEQDVTLGGDLYQFDLSSGNPAAMLASKTLLDTGVWADMQIVEDKVYVVKLGTGNDGCGVINNPDVAGVGCNFNPNSFNFIGITMIIGTTQNYVVYANPGTQFNSKDTAGCSTNMMLSGDANALSYLWNTGANTQSVNITAPGTYWVTAQFPCNMIVDTFHVTHQKDTIVSVIDTNICNGMAVVLSGHSSATSYLWNNGSTAQDQVINTTGQYWVRSVFECDVFIDTFDVVDDADTITNLKDTVICAGAIITLTGRSGAALYQWSDGSTQQPLSFSMAGQYWVRSVFACEVYIDTFNISVISLEVDLGNDTTLCNGALITLSVNITGATYQWQDGSTGQGYTTGAEGTYSVIASKQGCTAVDTINITTAVVSVMLDDVITCAGDSVVLDITQPGATYLWQDGSTAPVYTATQQGNYQATATIGGCSATDGFYLDHFHFAKAGIITAPWTYCMNEQVTLKVLELPGYSYVWQNDAQGPVLEVNSEGLYVVTITNACESYTDSIHITYRQCDCIDYMPNVFTPNNDGKNDKIGVGLDCDPNEFELVIYNRWGNMIFQTNDPQQKWDGFYKGEPADVGTYGFYYQFVSPRGDEVQRKGMIHLLR